MVEYLIRSSQLAVEIEATAGTAETLAAADVTLNPLQDGFSYEPDPQRFDNIEVRDDLSRSPDFVAAVPATMNVPVTIKNSGTLATAPAIGKLLRGCGLQETAVQSITADSAPSGGDNVALQGEVYTATGGKSGICAADISAGGPFLFVSDPGTTDIAATDTVTFSDSDSFVVSGAVTAAGWQYRPRTTGQETLTMQRAIPNTAGTASKDLIQRLLGAMGTGTLDFEALNAARASFAFQGSEDDAGYDGDVFTGTTPETVAIGTVPKFINATLEVNSIPCVRISTMSLDMGNEVTLEPDPTTCGGASGYDFARVSARNPQLTLDPRAMDTLDDHDLMRTGNTFAVSIGFGTSPQRIEVYAPAGQLIELGNGERGGFLTADKTISLTTDPNHVDHDYAIYFL